MGNTTQKEKCLICETKCNDLYCHKCIKIVNIIQLNPDNIDCNTQLILNNLSVREFDVIDNSNIMNKCKICDFQPKYILYNCLCKKCATIIRLYDISEILKIQFKSIDNIDIINVKFNDKRVHLSELLSAVSSTM